MKIDKQQLKRILLHLDDINYEYKSYRIKADFQYNYIRITFLEEYRVVYTFSFNLYYKFEDIGDIIVLSFRICNELDCMTKETKILNYSFNAYFMSKSFILSKENIEEEVKKVRADIQDFMKVACEQHKIMEVNLKQRLKALREKAIHKGMKLLSEDEILKLIEDRRSGKEEK